MTSLHYSVNYSSRDRFLKKKRGNQTVGLQDQQLAGEGGAPSYNFDFVRQIGKFWCKLGAFCTVHP